MEQNNYKVYIKIDEANKIIVVNSDAFLTDLINWIKIDEGIGDKYHHAQGNYFTKPLVNINGTHNYIYENSKVRETTDEEKQTELVEIEKQRQTPILKAQLQATDYKVIKQSEATYASISPLPYTTEEMESIYTERQAIRDKINELEGSIIV